jgi:hypothetical protein
MQAMTLRIQATSYPRWMIVFASLLALLNPKIDSALGCEQHVQVFGHTGISRGRTKLEVDDRRIDQRFMRIWSKGDRTQRAVTAAVTSIAR